MVLVDLQCGFLQRGLPSGPFTSDYLACRPQRHQIEADLRAGASYRAISRQYSLSKDAVSRHRASHVSLHTTPVLATLTKVIAILDEAETSATWKLSLLMVQRAKELLTQL
jgi:hypothetical protein